MQSGSEKRARRRNPHWSRLRARLEPEGRHARMEGCEPTSRARDLITRKLNFRQSSAFATLRSGNSAPTPEGGRDLDRVSQTADIPGVPPAYLEGDSGANIPRRVGRAWPVLAVAICSRDRDLQAHRRSDVASRRLRRAAHRP